MGEHVKLKTIPRCGNCVLVKCSHPCDCLQSVTILNTRTLSHYYKQHVDTKCEPQLCCSLIFFRLCNQYNHKVTFAAGSIKQRYDDDATPDPPARRSIGRRIPIGQFNSLLSGSSKMSTSSRRTTPWWNMWSPNHCTPSPENWGYAPNLGLQKVYFLWRRFLFAF